MKLLQDQEQLRLSNLKMTPPKNISDLILIWTGVITSFVTPFLPLLQFVAIVLAIVVSIKKLWPKDKKEINNV